MKTFLILCVLTVANLYSGGPLWLSLGLTVASSVIGAYCLVNGSMNLLLAISGDDDEPHASVDTTVWHLLTLKGIALEKITSTMLLICSVTVVSAILHQQNPVLFLLWVGYLAILTAWWGLSALRYPLEEAQQHLFIPTMPIYCVWMIMAACVYWPIFLLHKVWPHRILGRFSEHLDHAIALIGLNET